MIIGAICGCFHKVGVRFVGVLSSKIPLLGVYIGAPDCWKHPFQISLNFVSFFWFGIMSYAFCWPYWLIPNMPDQVVRQD